LLFSELFRILMNLTNILHCSTRYGNNKIFQNILFQNCYILLCKSKLITLNSHWNERITTGKKEVLANSKLLIKNNFNSITILMKQKYFIKTRVTYSFNIYCYWIKNYFIGLLLADAIPFFPYTHIILLQF